AVLRGLPEVLARGLGLDAQMGDRLEHAGGGRRRGDVTVLHGNLLVQGGRLRLGTGGAVHDASRQRPAHEQGDPVHRDPPLCRRPGSPPPVTFWNRCLNCCCACTSEALGSTSTVSRSVSPLVTSM